MKKKFTQYLKSFFLITGLLIAFSVETNAQEAEVIQGWDNLEEAEFFFDVYYQITKCSSESNKEVHLWAFNEGGKVDAVGFTLNLSDADGTKMTHVVEKFNIGFGESMKALCESDDYNFLKFNLPDDMDIETMSIEITYQK